MAYTPVTLDPEKATWADVDTWFKAFNVELIKLQDALTGLTATPAQLNTLTRVGAVGVAEASKAAVLGTNKNLDELHLATLYLGAAAGTAVTATAAELNVLHSVTAGIGAVASAVVLGSDGSLTLGTSGTPFASATAGKKFFDIYTQSTATSDDSRGIYNRHYLAGVGGGGESLRTYTDVVGVAVANAHGAHITLGFGESTTKGNVTGQGIAMRATLGIPDAAMAAAGTYAACQGEIFSFGTNSAVLAVTELSMFRAVNGGSTQGKGSVDDKANLISLYGFTAGAAHTVASKTAGACPNVTDSIRIYIDGIGLRYIYVGAAPLT